MNSSTSYEECSITKNGDQYRRNNSPWKYFHEVVVDNKIVCKCIICKANFTNNLARHLATHNIKESAEHSSTRIRQSRSFIWRYCSKVDVNYARCHLCMKLLYFGGGNTSNIAKHLRRIHPNVLTRDYKMRESDSEEAANATALLLKTKDDTVTQHTEDDTLTFNDSDNAGNSSGRKERKGVSYVWKYCQKLSRHSIRCNLCNKVMSFHGTANVITHLQRRHNILGRIEDNFEIGAAKNDSASNSQLDLVVELPDDEIQDDEIDDFVNNIKKRKRSAGPISIVWKYCTRISRDVVRCKFCKKNLSYQGTSNLQRHLHRMHGVVTRIPKEGGEIEDEQTEISNTNFIWEHCTVIGNENVRCNMCTSEFDINQTVIIAKHLTFVHAVSSSAKFLNNEHQQQSNIDFNVSSGYECDNGWNYANEGKKDDSFYNDIIEEDHDESSYNGQSLNENIAHEMPLDNPLSPQSSSSDPKESIPQIFSNNLRIQELTEARLRTETEYFREKTSYYRMQKYLTTLQAKKVQLEIKRMEATENGNCNHFS